MTWQHRAHAVVHSEWLEANWFIQPESMSDASQSVSTVGYHLRFRMFDFTPVLGSSETSGLDFWLAYNGIPASKDMGSLVMGPCFCLTPWSKSTTSHSTWPMVCSTQSTRVVLPSTNKLSLASGSGAVDSSWWPASAHTSTDFSPLGRGFPSSLIRRTGVGDCTWTWTHTLHDWTFLLWTRSTSRRFLRTNEKMPFLSDWGLQLQLISPQGVLHTELSAGQGFVVSDGSFKDMSGVATWIIEGSSSQYRLIGQWHMPGHDDNHSSFCSKVAGIVGILFTLTFWPPTSASPTFWLACDSLSAINWLCSSKSIEPMEPHADLLIAAWHLLLSCGYTIDLVFVHGHHDSGVPMVLSWDAWLNIEADQLAKAKVTQPHCGLHL